jgi:phenylacetate-CoA ligase
MSSVALPSPEIATPLRGRVYAWLQGIRGRPLGPFVQQLRQWERLSLAEFDRLRAANLDTILTVAKRQVPLYQSGPWAATSAARLDDWPVLDRTALNERYAELLAQPAPRPVVTRKTSGSSGVRAKIVFTAAADTWGWAHRYRGLLWHGIPIGVRSLRLSHDRRPFRDFLLDQCSVPALDSEAAVKKALEFLLRARPPLVAGPPSALFNLARRFRELGIRQPLAPFARVGGEQLFPFQRAEIERYLGRRAINSYGCMEIGALAGECSQGSLHIYAEHVHLEVFDGDRPARPGDFGDLVATALNNPAMPLVRYRIGDRGRLATEPCGCGLPQPVLAELQARSSDVFEAADGTVHHGAKLVERLGELYSDPAAAGVRQVQFVQRDPRQWTVLVEAQEAHFTGSDQVSDVLEGRLSGIVRAVFGSQCRVEVRYVTAVPRSVGKLRYYARESSAVRG